MDDVCKGCHLGEAARTMHVKPRAHGLPHDAVMIIGEAPGNSEDVEGHAFVGRAGKLLDEFIEAAELEHYYITNIVKCFPAKDGKPRKPTKKEIDRCKCFLAAEIDSIKPKAIVTLGNSSTGALTGEFAGISKTCGKPRHFNSEPLLGGEHTCTLIPCLHPSAVLRSGKNPEKVRKCVEALSLARKIAEN